MVQAPGTATRDEDRASASLGRDIGVALFFLAWAGVGWASLLTGPELFDLDGGRDPGPALMPLIVLTVLMAGGLALMVRPALALLSGRTGFGSVHVISWRPVVFFLSVAAFPLLMTTVGYRVATAAFVMVWVLVLSPAPFHRPVRNVILAAVAAAAAVLVIYLAFAVVIGTPLP